MKAVQQDDHQDTGGFPKVGAEVSSPSGLRSNPQQSFPRDCLLVPERADHVRGRLVSLGKLFSNQTGHELLTSIVQLLAVYGAMRGNPG